VTAPPRASTPTLLAVALAPVALAAAGPARAQGELDPITVEVQASDAFSGEALPGVIVEVSGEVAGEGVASGETGPDGRVTLELPAPGTYDLSYRHPGHVSIEGSPTELHDGQVVTTSLTPDLESEGLAGQLRVRVVLNWGSDRSHHVKDADAHLYAPAHDAHVYFADPQEDVGEARFTLDVDDREWGGPETIALVAPPAGTYRYWVHDYGGSSAALGGSEVVVRVFVGDALEGEYRPPVEAIARHWQPFRAIEVGGPGGVEVVAWSDAEIADGAPSDPPDAAGLQAGDRTVTAGSIEGVEPLRGLCFGAVVLGLGVAFFARIVGRAFN